MKQLKNYPNHFISDTGRIYSQAGGKNLRQLKPFMDAGGYMRINLERRKTFSLHRLIAIHFIPNPENKPQVNHINGDKTDNDIRNLEWMTDRENKYHAWKKLGVKNPLGIKV